MVTRLEWRTNNAYDSILLVADGKVVGDWTVTPHVLLDFLHTPADEVQYWEPNGVDHCAPSAYGNLVQTRSDRGVIDTYEERYPGRMEFFNIDPDKSRAEASHEMKVGERFFQANGELNGMPWDIGECGAECRSRQEAENLADEWVSSLTERERESAETYVREYVVDSIDDDGSIGTCHTVDND